MALLQTYNLDGGESGSIELEDRFFDIPLNEALLKEVYVALSANEREVIAHTKGRGERAGSGKKPWKQKHTGRARAGSVRSPLWRKGGVVFGPKNTRNFSKKVNKKAKQKAFSIAMSEKLRRNQMKVLDSFELSQPKTKLVASALQKLGVSEKSLVLGFLSSEKSFERAGQNIALLTSRSAHTLNVKDILDHHFLLMSREGIQHIQDRMRLSAKEL
ncbi:MAG: 50S ribosomal protein L4 [Candidatus Moraniibacteriota bacterium]|nr:MAG: 50S ribosomal protein L4 [Candidatus Moranbacteria bacterium]